MKVRNGSPPCVKRYDRPWSWRKVARDPHSWPIRASAKPAIRPCTHGGIYWPPTAEQLDWGKAAPSLTPVSPSRPAQEKTAPAECPPRRRIISIDGGDGVQTAPSPIVTPPRSPGPAVGDPIYLLTMDPIALGNTSPRNGCAPQ